MGLVLMGSEQCKNTTNHTPKLSITSSLGARGIRPHSRGQDERLIPTEDQEFAKVVRAFQLNAINQNND